MKTCCSRGYSFRFDKPTWETKKIGTLNENNPERSCHYRHFSFWSWGQRNQAPECLLRSDARVVSRRKHSFREILAGQDGRQAYDTAIPWRFRQAGTVSNRWVASRRGHSRPCL